MAVLDSMDHRILDVLRREGRISVLELAERVGLSPTPCGRRVKRMEDAGVIKGYGARIDPAALGLTVSALCSVRLRHHGAEGTEHFLSVVARRPEITECLLVAGDVDYVLRIWARDLDALGTFIRDVLQSIPAVAETTTMVILKQDNPCGAAL